MESGEHSREHQISLHPAESEEKFLSRDEVHHLHADAIHRMRAHTETLIEHGASLPPVDDEITRPMRAVSERAAEVSRLNPSAKLLRDALLEHVDLTRPVPNPQLEAQFKKDVEKQMKVEEALLRKQGRGDDDTALKERRTQVEARLIRDREAYSSLAPSVEPNIQKQVTTETLEERYKKAEKEYKQRMDALWADQDETKNTRAREAKDKMIAAKRDYDAVRGPTLQELEVETARRQAEIDSQIAALNSRTRVASSEFTFGKAKAPATPKSRAVASVPTPTIDRTAVGEATVVQPSIPDTEIPVDQQQIAPAEQPLNFRLLPIDQSNFGSEVKKEVDALQNEYRNKPSEDNRRLLDQKLRELGLMPDSNPLGVIERIRKEKVKTPVVEVILGNENHPEEGELSAFLGKAVDLDNRIRKQKAEDPKGPGLFAPENYAKRKEMLAAIGSNAIAYPDLGVPISWDLLLDTYVDSIGVNNERSTKLGAIISSLNRLSGTRTSSVYMTQYLNELEHHLQDDTDDVFTKQAIDNVRKQLPALKNRIDDMYPSRVQKTDTVPLEPQMETNSPVTSGLRNQEQTATDDMRLNREYRGVLRESAKDLDEESEKLQELVERSSIKPYDRLKSVDSQLREAVNDYTSYIYGREVLSKANGPQAIENIGEPDSVEKQRAKIRNAGAVYQRRLSLVAASLESVEKNLEASIDDAPVTRLMYANWVSKEKGLLKLYHSFLDPEPISGEAFAKEDTQLKGEIDNINTQLKELDPPPPESALVPEVVKPSDIELHPENAFQMIYESEMNLSGAVYGLLYRTSADTETLSVRKDKLRNAMEDMERVLDGFYNPDPAKRFSTRVSSSEVSQMKPVMDYLAAQRKFMRFAQDVLSPEVETQTGRELASPNANKETFESQMSEQLRFVSNLHSLFDGQKVA